MDSTASVVDPVQPARGRRGTAVRPSRAQARADPLGQGLLQSMELRGGTVRLGETKLDARYVQQSDDVETWRLSQPGTWSST